VNNELAARVEALLQQGFALHEQRRLDEARVLYEQVLQLRPQDFRAWYLLGVIALQQNHPQRAVELIGKAILIDPQSAEAHNDHGRAQFQLDRYEAAIASYDKAIAIKPNNAQAYNNRGNALYELKQYEAAIASYDQTIALKSDHSAGHYNRSNALCTLKRYEAAIAGYDKAIALKPGHSGAYNKRGNALFELGQYEAAIASYDKAIALKYDYPDAHNNRGNALYRLKQYQAALDSYDTALALDSSYAGGYFNRGKMLHELRQYEAAIASYDMALALKSDLKPLHGMRLNAKIQICDWADLEAEVAQLTARIERDEAASNPFTVLALSDSAPLQKRAAELWVQQESLPNLALPAIPKRAQHDKIRIGYFSADYHNHATLHLMAGLFEAHDRSRFELIALSFGPDSQDEMRKRLKAACEDFIDVRNQSDQEVALAARNLQIDIAIDLKGFTQDGRPGIFALRCAPLQVSYLGYPGTMGAAYIDYLIADLTLVPEGNQRHYSEKIIYLPNSYQVNDAKRSIADKVFTREELGLPQEGFVFCCFNNNYKITPGTFDGWMRILQRVEGSVLWLFEENPRAASNLRQAALRRGVNAERLIFAKRMTPPEHLARHRVADLFIDTLPCNAHTTASDSLWAGLPVLTCVGNAFAGRVAASLLNAIRLPELITSTQAQYEDLAVELATKPQRLAEIKHKLADNRTSTPLFDTLLYTKQLEAAYTEIYARYRAGLPPEHLFV